MPNGHNDNAVDYQDDIAKLESKLKVSREKFRDAERRRIWEQERANAGSATIVALMDERDRLRALLREVEWGPVNQEARCILCGGQPDGPWRGHVESCRLKAAIDGNV